MSAGRPPPVELVPMAAAHLDGVCAIENASEKNPWSRAMFENELAYPDAVFVVALHHGTVLGYAGYRAVAGEAEIMNVAVHPELRRQGFGRVLLGELLERMAAAGLTDAFLEVRVGNAAAIALYESFGFQKVGERPGYYRDGEDALLYGTRVTPSR